MLIGPILKDSFKSYIPDNPVIIEAGAHIGRDTRKLITLFPKATLYAFEPVPALFEKLTTATQEFPQVKRFNLALSDHTGHETLYISSGASTAVSSLLEPHEYATKRPEVQFTPQQVKTITLDQWAEDEGVTAVDFMWLDMQGAELRVLTAAPRIFATVRALMFEVSLTERFKGNPLYDEAVYWISSQGFTVVQQDVPKHDKINLLCVRTTVLGTQKRVPT